MNECGTTVSKCCCVCLSKQPKPHWFNQWCKFRGQWF